LGTCIYGVEIVNLEPFPHKIIENYLDPERAAQVVAELNSVDISTWHYDSNVAAHQVNKRWMDDVNQLPRTVAEVLKTMNSELVLSLMEELTGISDLIPDHTYLGGGVHVTETGGSLGLHVDFNIHPVTNLHRRVNALLYLNQNWDYRWHGELELHGNGIVKKIEPTFNRLVVFPITDDHVHGQPTPLACPPHRKRFSLALYYYTTDRPDKEKAPFHWADWK